MTGMRTDVVASVLRDVVVFGYYRERAKFWSSQVPIVNLVSYALLIHLVFSSLPSGSGEWILLAWTFLLGKAAQQPARQMLERLWGYFVGNIHPRIGTYFFHQK